jgi:hypothetical protein
MWRPMGQCGPVLDDSALRGLPILLCHVRCSTNVFHVDAGLMGQCWPVPDDLALRKDVMYCTVMYCTVLYCIVTNVMFA